MLINWPKKQLQYVLRRGAYLIGSLWIVITLTFILMKVIPGDPFGEEQSLPKEIHDALLHHYGLDQSWSEQYLNYLQSIIKWDLGPSYKYKDRTVNDIIREGFPISALLGFEALLVSLLAGTFLGVLGALKAQKWQDHLILILTTVGISIPSFILASLLQYFFAIKWHFLPLARWGSFSQTILPCLALSAMPTAFIMRLVRSNLLEVLQCDYIKMAKAKGLSPFSIIWRHGLRNAFLPVLSYLGQLIANILVGSFIIEKIFSIPGLGQWLVNSVSNRDYTVIMGLTIFYSIILMTAVLLVDMTYGLLDPRIQMKRDNYAN